MASPEHHSRSPNDRREHRVVQTSAVVVPGVVGFQADFPPSPPSPPTSSADGYFEKPFNEFSLNSHCNFKRISGQLPPAERRLRGALHFLDTQSAALLFLKRVYENDTNAREGFCAAVEAIVRLRASQGKLVIVGVGKSGLIGKKLVATFNSLGIQSVFLHPTEALHGDLGIIGHQDAVMFISFSGATQELMSLLPHVDKSPSVILLSSHASPHGCEFIRHLPRTILLPAPIPETERSSFGVPAPTTSTTVALAVGDALAITAAEELHQDLFAVFARNHPGGAIGASLTRPETVKDIAVPWVDLPTMNGSLEVAGADLLRAGFDSESGWVRVGDGVVPSRRIRAMANKDLSRPLKDMPGLVVRRDEMPSIAADTSLRRAVDLVINMLAASDHGELVCKADSTLAVVDKGEIVGVLEVGELMARKDSLESTASAWASRG